MKNRKAFTLIELLVVIAIIALLMSIMTPALKRAKEHARKVTCAANLRGLGTGFHLYAEDSDQKLIPNAHYDTGAEYIHGINPALPPTTPSTFKPWYSYLTGLDVGDPELKPIQLGKLFSLGYIEVPDVYYCPTPVTYLDSMVSRAQFEKDHYTTNLVKSMPNSGGSWGIPDVSAEDVLPRCRSSYMYWTWEKVRLTEVSIRPLIVENLLTVIHQKAGEPEGANALFGDGHVNFTRFSTDDDLLNYVSEPNWETKSQDYQTCVQALRRIRP
jgi:prepilin-type N-terminal cleavage/methylation domain-containing protein/prepilin-type processing-associated H-X9-DG protein